MVFINIIINNELIINTYWHCQLSLTGRYIMINLTNEIFEVVLPEELLRYEVTKWLTDIDHVMLDLALNNYSKTKPQWLKKYPMGMMNRDVIELSDVGLCIIIRCGLANTLELSWQLVQKGRTAMVKWYIDNKIPFHRCAINYCAQEGQVDCLRLLLDAGYKDTSMVGYAVSHGRTNCLQLLYQRNFTMDDVDGTNNWLVNTIRRGHWDSIEFLYANNKTYLKRNFYVVIPEDLPKEQYPLIFKVLLLGGDCVVESMALNNIEFLKYVLKYHREHIMEDIANSALEKANTNRKTAAKTLRLLLDNNFKITRVERLVYTWESYKEVRELLIARGIIPATPPAPKPTPSFDHQNMTHDRLTISMFDRNYEPNHELAQILDH